MLSDESCLLIIDVQERLILSVYEPHRVISGCAILMQAANLIGIPIVVSEQYVKGLGSTVAALRPFALSSSRYEKEAFGCATDVGIMACLDHLNKRQVIIAGIETHICVLQSALGLKTKGLTVFVVSDACSSRRIESEQVGYIRMTMCGVYIVTIEMVLFEWLGSKHHPAFKEVQKLIK